MTTSIAAELTHENLKRLDSQNSLSPEPLAKTQDPLIEVQAKKMNCLVLPVHHEASAITAHKIKTTGTHRRTQTRARISIGDFERLAVLGEGAFGKVYRVLWRRTGKKYALKRIEKSLLIREGKQKQAIIQKDTMLYLDHPQVVRLFETFQDRKYFYYVMELLPNGTLAELYDRRQFTPAMVKHYVAEIVALLDHLFSKKVAHRDLKPQNLLLDEGFHLKLADFGTSKRLSGEPEMRRTSTGSVEGNGDEMGQRKGTLVGTRLQARFKDSYVAPEVLNEECSGYAADLWSLGCIIYKLICGKTPFEADNDYLVNEKIKNVDLTFSKAFDETAIDLITRLLKLRPEARIGMSGDDFKQTAMNQIKDHPYFAGIDFDTIFQTQVPEVVTGRKPKPQKEPRKISDQTDFSTPHGKTRTDDLSTEADTPLVKMNTRLLQLSGYFDKVVGEPEGRDRGVTHLSVSPFIREEGIFEQLESTKPSFAFYGPEEGETCTLPIQQSKYFEPVKIFAKPQMQEAIFHSKMIYLLRNKKIIASLTSEPRLLLCDPTTNTILEDIPLTLSLDITKYSEKEVLIKTTYGRSYRFKDSSTEARDKWVNLIQFAIRSYNKPKASLI